MSTVADESFTIICFKYPYIALILGFSFLNLEILGRLIRYILYKGSSIFNLGYEFFQLLLPPAI